MSLFPITTALFTSEQYLESRFDFLLLESQIVYMTGPLTAVSACLDVVWSDYQHPGFTLAPHPSQSQRIGHHGAPVYIALDNVGNWV